MLSVFHGLCTTVENKKEPHLALFVCYGSENFQRGINFKGEKRWVYFRYQNLQKGSSIHSNKFQLYIYIQWVPTIKYTIATPIFFRHRNVELHYNTLIVSFCSFLYNICYVINIRVRNIKKSFPKDFFRIWCVLMIKINSQSFSKLYNIF